LYFFNKNQQKQELRLSLFQGDVILKTAVELAIEDIKKDPWLVDDIFSDFIDNPMLKQKYGQKEIDRAKEWILNNKINFYMKYRVDNMDFPAITISMGNSNEDKSLATLADQSICVEELDPCQINKPISYIVKPFKVKSYDKDTGIIEAPEGTKDINLVNKDMVAIDPDTGSGFIINGKAGENGFSIAPGSDLNVDKIAVIPRYQLYRARRERIISQESYNIGCHSHGDPSTLLFLFHLTKYALLRYREGLFESNNFQLGTIQCTDMVKNDAFGQDNVYSRFITLSGQAEEDWLKTPFRVWEAAELIDRGEALDPGIGIKVCSNKNTVKGSDEDQNDLWQTIDNDDEE
jgi:hypothetical protein